MGFEWGVNVNVSSFKDEGVSQAYEKKQSGLGVGFGILMGDLDAYANVGLKDEANGGAAASGDKWEATMGINVGANYKWHGYTFFADYKKGGVEETASGVKTENTANEMTVGAARVMKLHRVAVGFMTFAGIKINLRTKLLPEQMNTQSARFL